MKTKKKYKFIKKSIFIISLISFGFILSDFKASLINKFQFFFSEYTLQFQKKTDTLYQSSLNSFVDTIKVNIANEDFQSLSKMRMDALNGRRKFKYVDGNIVKNNDTVKLAIKLKGDRPIHYKKQKGWSFRLKSNNTLYKNLNAFSLHHPGCRNYIYEEIYHKLLKSQQIHFLHYDFVQLNINGNNWGVYALEEFFSQKFFINNSLIPSAVFRFSEDYGTAYSSYPLFKPFKGSYTNNPKSSKQISHAISLMNKFRSQKLLVSEVFDEEKMAKIFALQDVFGFHHGGMSKSMRFYFNPKSKKLEPIGYDGHFGCDAGNSYLSIEFPFSNDSWFSKDDNEWFSLFFNSKTIDTTFMKLYVNALEKFSDSTFIRNFLEKNQKKLDASLAIIHRNYTPKKDHIGYFGPEKFEYDSCFWKRKALNAYKKINPVQAIHSYVEDVNNEKIIINISNIQYFPVQIIGLIINDIDTLILKNKKLLTFSKKYNFDTVIFDFNKGSSPNSINGKKFKLIYSLLGSTKILYSKIPKFNFLSKDSNPTTSNLLIKDSINKIVKFKSKNVLIDSKIIIPRGYIFLIEKGTIINIKNSGSILSYSTPFFIGTEDQPILFHASDNSSLTLSFLDCQKKGILNYVFFKNFNFTESSQNGLINFFKSDVKINHCSFVDIKSNHVLSFFQSKISIRNSGFYNSGNGAIKSRFSEAYLRKCEFINTKENALNLSNSNFRIEDLIIKNSKNISIYASKNSKLIAEKIYINNSKVGLLCSDNTESKINNLSLLNCKIGLLAYQSDSDYDKSMIDANFVTFKNVSKKFIREFGSSLLCNGISRSRNSADGRTPLYDAEIFLNEVAI